MNWTHSAVNRETWQQAGERLHSGKWSLLGLWGEPGHVHMAVMDRESSDYRVLRLACDEGRFPSVGRLHPPAIRPERAIRDLVGLEPEGSPDARPWLRHNGAYQFLPAEGESLHQIPVGPVHAGIIEPGHFRFTANGETVVRLEDRLGYAHKGIEALMAGASIERAAVLAGRVSGDSTVAYSLAFARAVEAALDIEIPPRAVWLRALLAELERLANHFGDIGAICNDAAFAIMHAQFGLLREHVLRTAEACFAHRLMMDRVIPGGLQCDLPSDGPERLGGLLAEIRRRFPELVELYANTPSLTDRTHGTCILSPALAQQFAPAGYVRPRSRPTSPSRGTPRDAPFDRF